MSLTQAIHLQWAENAALTDKIPAERFITGTVPPSVELPFGTLQIISERPEVYTSGASYLETIVAEISIRGSSLQEAIAIRAAVDNVFHQQPMTMIDGIVLSVERLRGTQQREKSGVWRCDWHYQFLLQKALST